jgi:hypothetical protein
MNTALLAPETSLDDQERKFVSSIREHGWYRTCVFAEGDQPEFSFTTGLWVTLGQPELVVVGLKSEIAHAVFWDVFRNLQAGSRLPLRTRTGEVFGNLPACLFNMDKKYYPDYLGWSRWFYAGDDFPCLQLVWPDRAGVFPWEPNFDLSMAGLQPDLAEGGWGEISG